MSLLNEQTIKRQFERILDHQIDPKTLDTFYKDLEETAQSGLPSAAYWMGEIYFLGIERDSDWLKARPWYEMAVQGNIPDAALKLGCICNATEPADSINAINWWRLACSQGSETAAFELARAYAAGKRVKADPLQAKAYLKKCGDYPPAFWLEALMIRENFLEGPQEKVRELLQRAAQANFAPAILDLGRLHLDRESDAYDEKRALSYIKKAAKEGLPEAYHCLGECYESGIAGQKNLKTAIKHFKTAAQGGYVPAMERLGVLYHYEGKDNNAFAWLAIAAKSGSESGMRLFFSLDSDWEDLSFYKDFEPLVEQAVQAKLPSAIIIKAGHLLDEAQDEDDEAKFTAAKALYQSVLGSDVNARDFERGLACFYLGSMACDEDDLDEAERIWGQGVKFGDQDCLEQLGASWLLYSEHDQERRKGLEIVRRCHKEGRAYSTYTLALAYREGLIGKTGKPNHKQALAYYREAAERDFSPAQEYYGLHLLKRYLDSPEKVTQQEREDALMFLTLAAQEGEMDAMQALIDVHEKGLLGKVDKKLARQWKKVYEDLTQE